MKSLSLNKLYCIWLEALHQNDKADIKKLMEIIDRQNALIQRLIEVDNKIINYYDKL